ncbi:ABC transporter permease [Amylibacter ulvae]|uniref:ABC transporter permease n=1 Tax=Paramylibacter ulvae TaxID=1651968 RepID=A0ABQ3D8M9_9RHOB|nr:EamA family transporter [Amylibacter ulvae]GHA55191.1 ABC transporter permease [Amylibacter ulvae]
MVQQTKTAWVLLFILGIVWGGSFMGAKLALASFGPMTVATLRLLIAAVFLLAINAARGGQLPGFSTPVDKRIWMHILAMGFFTNALPFSLLNWGQLYVTSGFAGITMAVVPLLILPLAHFLIAGEQMNFRKFIGFAIGFIGVVVLIGPSSLLTNSGASMEPTARMACIAAACCYAIGSMNTRLCPPVPTISYSAAGLLLGTLMLLPVALYFEGIPNAPTTSALMGTIYLGIFPTALATLMLVYVINTAGPSFLSLVNYQVPIWAVIFGVLLLGEALPSQFIAALGLILIGLLISQWFTVMGILRRG